MSLLEISQKDAWEASFSEILQQLNAEQWKAVKTLEGPVFAIAGPGTGKTHMLTARIGHILQQTDTQAHNILCLTFTDAGVQAMRNRLIRFIGPQAHRVHIFTFHAFCNKVIQENLAYFGHRNMQAISDLERVEVIREILYSLPYSHILRKQYNAPYYYEKHLRNLFQEMKKEQWSVELIEEKIEAYIANLPQREEFYYKRNTATAKAGEIKQKDIDTQIEKMELLRAAVKLFPLYENTLAQRGRYDFEDMILWVNNAFTTQEHILRTYQEQYLYFLVDEFQDTNGAQKALIDHLVSYWGNNPNLFIVGDDDQAIYEFQGARINNLTDLLFKYEEHLELVVLQHNYRSSQDILDASTALIQKNQARLINQLPAIANSKTLVAANFEASTLGLDIELNIYPTQLQEEIDIIERIKKLRAQGIPLHEIAIIFARHNQARNLVRLLERSHIPYETKRRIDVLQLPLIQSIRQLLKYFDTELQVIGSGDGYLYEILQMEFIGISPKDLQILFKTYLEQRRAKDGEYTWLNLLEDDNLLQNLNLNNYASLNHFIRARAQLLHSAHSLTLPEFVERMYNYMGILHFAMQKEQKTWYLEVMYTFFDFVHLEYDRKPNMTLSDLLEIWQKMQDNRIELGMQKNNYEEEGVQLITAHSAKGLEFQHVFIINCVQEYWQPTEHRGTGFFAYPDNLTFAQKSDEEEASRRLFYVAMTRARYGLYLSYFQNKGDGKECQRSIFLDELLISNNVFIKQTNINLPTSKIVQMQALLLSEHALTNKPLFNRQQALQMPMQEIIDKVYVAQILQDFKMSVSALNTYLSCNAAFYYEYILQVPHTTNAQALYGTAIHEALQRLFEQSISKHKLSNDDVLLYFAKESLYRQPMSNVNRLHYNDLLHAYLPYYYQQRQTLWSQEIKTGLVQTEKVFKHLELQGVPLIGVIDKMVLYTDDKGGKYWAITDYKTGKLKNDYLDAPNEKNPFGGHYWRQLVFYKILLELSPLAQGYPAKVAYIDYLTPNKEQEFEIRKIEIEDKDKIFMKNLIKETYQKIIQQDFSKVCMRSNCKWCQFLVKNQETDTFANFEIEALDDF